MLLSFTVRRQLQLLHLVQRHMTGWPCIGPDAGVAQRGVIVIVIIIVIIIIMSLDIRLDAGIT